MVIAKLNNVIFDKEKDVVTFFFVKMGTDIDEARLTSHSDEWLSRVYGIKPKAKKKQKDS